MLAVRGARRAVVLGRRLPARRGRAAASSPRAEGGGERPGWRKAADAVAPVVDGLSNLVPESVPRPVAKAGVAVLGTGLVLWTVSSLFKTAVSLAAFGLLGFVAFTIFLSSGGGGDDGGASGGKDGEEDPLDEARRIMGKYKS